MRRSAITDAISLAQLWTNQTGETSIFVTSWPMNHSQYYSLMQVSTGNKTLAGFY